MSSAVLYLAIVVVWGIVLVPMWLRRDGARSRPRRTGTDLTDTEAVFDEDLAYEDDDDVPVTDRPRHPATRHGGPSRATVIARRRRRTLGCTLLMLLSAGTVTGGLTPWWFVLPPLMLLAGHLALLRVAVKIDAERRHEHRIARIRAFEAERRAHEAEEARRTREARENARIIALPERPREEVYDQYRDQRAVGD